MKRRPVAEKTQNLRGSASSSGILVGEGVKQIVQGSVWIDLVESVGRGPPDAVVIVV